MWAPVSGAWRFVRADGNGWVDWHRERRCNTGKAISLCDERATGCEISLSLSVLPLTFTYTHTHTHTSSTAHRLTHTNKPLSFRRSSSSADGINTAEDPSPTNSDRRPIYTSSAHSSLALFLSPSLPLSFPLQGWLAGERQTSFVSHRLLRPVQNHSGRSAVCPLFPQHT